MGWDSSSTAQVVCVVFCYRRVQVKKSNVKMVSMHGLLAVQGTNVGILLTSHGDKVAALKPEPLTQPLLSDDILRQLGVK